MNKNFIKNCIENFQKLPPEKVFDEYLDNYKTDDKDNLFILFFNTTQKIKIHIWAQILAISGWGFLSAIFKTGIKL